MNERKPMQDIGVTATHGIKFPKTKPDDCDCDEEEECQACRDKRIRAEGYAEAMTKFNSMREAEKERTHIITVKIRAEGKKEVLDELEADGDLGVMIADWRRRKEAQKQSEGTK